MTILITLLLCSISCLLIVLAYCPSCKSKNKKCKRCFHYYRLSRSCNCDSNNCPYLELPLCPKCNSVILPTNDMRGRFINHGYPGKCISCKYHAELWADKNKIIEISNYGSN